MSGSLGLIVGAEATTTTYTISETTLDIIDSDSNSKKVKVSKSSSKKVKSKPGTVVLPEIAVVEKRSLVLITGNTVLSVLYGIMMKLLVLSLSV